MLPVFLLPNIVFPVHCVYLKTPHLHKPGEGEEFLFKYSRYKLAFRSVVEKTKTCVSGEKIQANLLIRINLTFRIWKKILYYSIMTVYTYICSKLSQSRPFLIPPVYFAEFGP